MDTIGAESAVAGVPYDPFDPAVIADPYPWYRWLRANSPCHFVPERELFVVSRHADAVEVLRGNETFISGQGITYGEGNKDSLGIVTTDPPDHGRLRRIVSRSFAPKAVAQLEDYIAGLVDQLIDEALEEREVDWIQAVGLPLPTTVIAHILGIPTEDRADFRRWSEAIIEIMDTRLTADGRRTAELEREECKAYLREMIAERQKTVGTGKTDILSTLLEAQEGGALTATEALAFSMTLLVAGNETTGAAVASGLLAMIQHPDERRRLADEPTLLQAAIEEVLRFDAPVQGFTRVAATDAEVAGVRIPAGSRVLVLFGSANRDGAVFDRGDTFRVDRDPRGHLAFGIGAHTCIGAPLARLELRLLGEALARRVATILPRGVAERTHTPFTRGVVRFPVHMVPR